MHCTYSYTLFIHALHSSMHCTYSSFFMYQLYMYYICSYITFIYVLHSSMRCTYLYIAFIYLLHSFHVSHSFNDALHLLMHCIHLCIALFMHYIIFLFSRINYATCSLFTPFFSLIYIKFQNSWQECSATTMKISMQADVHKIHYWPTQLLFSLDFNNLNVYFCQSIFYSYEPGACSLNQTSPPRFIAMHYFFLLYKELFSTFSHTSSKISAFFFLLPTWLCLTHHGHRQSLFHKCCVNFQTLKESQLQRMA